MWFVVAQFIALAERHFTTGPIEIRGNRENLMIVQRIKRRTVATPCFYGPFVLLFAVVALLNFAGAENETEWMPDADLRRIVQKSLPKSVLMPDGNLASGVRKALGLAPGSPLRREQLQGLTRLILPHHQITDLTGLEHATQLEVLYLHANQVVSVTPLAKLTRLKKLYLSRNKISDIAPLAKLMDLTTLQLSQNEISNITPLSTLMDLKDLALQANQVGTIKVLVNLKELEHLNLSDNQIDDITPLAKLTRLQTLSLDTNQISDIRDLTQLTNLKVLRIQSNPVQDVTPLRTLLEGNPKMTIDVGFVDKSLCPAMYWIDMENGTLHCLIGDTVAGVFLDIQNATGRPLNCIIDTGGIHTIPDAQKATSLALKDSDYYWTEKADDNTWRIRRAKRESGTTARILDFPNGEIQVTGIPMDMAITERHLYVPVSSGKIQRLYADDPFFRFEPDFITGLASPKHLVADIFGEKLYWTEKTRDGTWQIRGATQDGSNVQSVRMLESAPLGLAIDVSAGQLYVSVTSGKIQRLRVDGSDFQPDFITTGLVSPGSLDVDVGGGKVYWTEKDGIWRASLNGENIERVVAGLGVPNHLVLDVRLPIATRTR